MSADSSDGATRRLPAGRKAELASYVAQRGEVTVAHLAKHFEVSADTIRRDLDQLDSEGVLVRTHGGAVSPGAMPRPDTGLDVRLRLRAEAKDAIGRLAASLVDDSMALIVNAGTTTLAVARHLQHRRQLTVATNSLTFSAELSEKVYRDLYLFGGAVRPSAQATIGPVRMPAAGSQSDLTIRCDLALIGVGAVDGDGYSTSNLAEAAMMAEMMACATTVAVLADAAKFDRRLFAQIAALDRASFLVTDAAPPADLAAALDAAGVTVLSPDSSPAPLQAPGQDPDGE